MRLRLTNFHLGYGKIGDMVRHSHLSIKHNTHVPDCRREEDALIITRKGKLNDNNTVPASAGEMILNYQKSE